MVPIQRTLPLATLLLLAPLAGSAQAGTTLQDAWATADGVLCGHAQGEPCRNWSGDPGLFASRPCRPTNSNPHWVILYPVVDWTGVCGERSPRNLTLDAARRGDALLP